MAVFKRQHLVEIPALPLSICKRLPVDRVICGYGFAPPPARHAPELLSPVATLCNEGSELLVAHCGARHRKRLNLYGMSPLLVIKYKSGIRSAAEPEATTGNHCIAEIICGGKLLSLDSTGI